MPKFINTHGNIILPKGADGKQKVVGIGEEIELTLEQRNHLDPSGMQLVTPEVFAEMKKSADAHVALEEAQRKAADSPKASSSVPVKTLKAIAALKGTTTATPAPKGVAK